VTQACHGDRDRKQHFRRGGGKHPTRGPSPAPAGLARSRAGPTDLHSVWLAHGSAALANPQRQSQAAAHRKRRPGLADDNIDTR